MPLPWKKTKVTRISRLVADLQSPKRGGSLVVETGFPTSLIDLFVKNRDRLKKKKSRPQSECSDPVTTPLPSLSISEKSTGNSIDNKISRRVNEEQVEEVIKHEKVAECVVSVNGSKAQSVFVAVLRMFVVVVLALSTKKLAVGITMSAFALLFLEYVGKHLFEPCSKAQQGLDSLIQRVLSLFRDKKEVLMMKKEIVEYQDSRNEVVMQQVTLVSNSCGLIDDVELSSSSIEEIEGVESNCGSMGRGKSLDCLDVGENEDRGEVLICNKNERSKRAKIKAKFIKKFVPKKLRGSKKGSKSKEKEPESSSEISVCVGEDKLGRIEEHENGEKQEQDDEEKSSKSTLEEECCQGLDDGISSLGAQLAPVVDMGVVEEKVGRETKGNSGYLILLLIVLAGLVGGRVPALVLTVVCCLMLGFFGRLKRSINVPMIRSPVPISS